MAVFLTGFAPHYSTTICSAITVPSALAPTQHLESATPTDRRAVAHKNISTLDAADGKATIVRRRHSMNSFALVRVFARMWGVEGRQHQCTQHACACVYACMLAAVQKARRIVTQTCMDGTGGAELPGK